MINGLAGKAKRLLSHLSSRIFLNSSEKDLLKKLREIELDSLQSSFEKKEKINVIMQMPEDYFFLIKFFLFYIVLRKKFKHVDIHLIQLSDSLFRKSKISLIQNSFLYDLKWNKIYKYLFRGKIVFNFNIQNTTVDDSDRNEAEKIFSSFKTKNDVLETKYKNYKIGTLSYNYYLRATDQPTVDLKSDVLFEIILNAIRSINELEKLFIKNKYDLFLTSYITYTAHGVPALVALENRAKVFAFSGLDQFYHEVFSSYFTHIKNHVRYKDLKKDLTKKNLLLAHEKMENRLKGIVDTSTSYMRHSAYSYSNNDFKFEPNKPCVVIYLHCFFDSPHIYRHMLFPDFYEWLTYTLTTLCQVDNLDIYIKKHPGASEANDIVIEQILKKFSSAKVIPKDFNNIQIAKEMNPLAALTVYGTVAHEMAYLGVPVICAGDNPHYDFDFQITPKDISSYGEILKSIQDLKKYSEKELKSIKEEVLKFYYLHNCYSFPEKLNMEEQRDYDYLLKLFRDGDLKDFIGKLNLALIDKLLKKISEQYFEEY